MLTEGGNVFKDETGRIKTQRINLRDIVPTVSWLEKVSGLALQDNMLGSTGQKPTSGDLDLAVDSTRTDKQTLIDTLSQYVKQLGHDPRDWIKKSGISVHFLTPIRGDSDQGFVQTDFMFLPKPNFSKFILKQDPNSEYKGATRNVLINSMAKSLGLKLNQTSGIHDRNTNDLVSDDPDQIAKMLLGNDYTHVDLGSVEKIFKALQADPNREDKIADFREYLAREGLPMPDELAESESGIMARLRDRIINQGMQVIVENDKAARKDPRIPHPEDFVFSGGATAAEKAIQGLEYAAQNAKDITIKWDGMPALIWGRMPDGSLAIMDKYMFDAGVVARNPQDWIKYDQQKSSGKLRPDLYQKLEIIWPLLDKATQGAGFYWGDLLWAGQLQPQDGFYVFQPNKVRYRIPVTPQSQNTVGNKQGGIVVHQYFQNLGDKTAQPWNGQGLQNVPKGMAILTPNFGIDFRLAAPDLSQARSAIKKYGPDVDQLLDSLPTSTRQRLQTYYNQRIIGATSLSLPNWLKIHGQSAKQYNNLVVGNPNTDGTYSAATGNVPGKLFTLDAQNKPIPSGAYVGLETIWQSVYQAKLRMAQQLEQQVRGLEQSTQGQAEGEGFVINTPFGLIKLVNRGIFGGGSKR